MLSNTAFGVQVWWESMRSRATRYLVVHLLFWYQHMAYLLQLAILVSLKSTQQSASTSSFHGCMGLAGMANFPGESWKCWQAAQNEARQLNLLLRAISTKPSGIYLLCNVGCCCTCIFVECCRLAGFLLLPVFASMAIMQDNVDCIEYWVSSSADCAIVSAFCASMCWLKHKVCRHLLASPIEFHQLCMET